MEHKPVHPQPVRLPEGLRTTITAEELAALPLYRYEGRVQLVTTESELAQARRHLHRDTVVGFDTETRPSFRKGQSFRPSLVQIAAADVVYLFQLQRLDCSELLRELLENERPAKAGVALSHDLLQLNHLFAVKARGLCDLGTAARRCGLAKTGVRNLAGIFLGCRIPKGRQTSNWARRELTPAQITYAATDAWVCRVLYLEFEKLGLLGDSGPGAAGGGDRNAK